MKTALLCAKELTADGCWLHLSTDDGLVRVAVPLDVAERAKLNVEIEVPDGSLTDRHVQAGIEWRF